jgi:hypothetical protein
MVQHLGLQHCSVGYSCVTHTLLVTPVSVTHSPWVPIKGGCLEAAHRVDLTPPAEHHYIIIIIIISPQTCEYHLENLPLLTSVSVSCSQESSPSSFKAWSVRHWACKPSNPGQDTPGPH